MNDNWMNGFGKKVGCHTGNPLVFEVDGIKVFAGGHSRNGGWHRMSPRPALALGPAQVMDDSRTVVPTGFSCAQHIGGGTHIISIDWPDFSIPQDVSRDFWVALVDDIRKQDITTVSTQCVGGHGRTGVQLCILGHLLGDEACVAQPDAAALIKHVRDIYCTHAVETDSQQLYIANTLGIPVGDSLFAKAKNKKSTNYFTDDITMTDDSHSYTDNQEWLADISISEEEKNMPIPSGFQLVGCAQCSELQWVHKDDQAKCVSCDSEELVDAHEALFATDRHCPEIDDVFTDMAMHPDGRSSLAHAKEKGIKTKNTNIKCEKCKRFYIPEVFRSDDFTCVACERKKKQKKGGKKKGGKKRGGKRQERLPVPEGGVDNESLLAFLERYRQ